MNLPRNQFLRTAPDARMRTRSKKMLGLFGLPGLGRSVVSSIFNSYAASFGLYGLPEVVAAGDVGYTTDNEGGTFPATTRFIGPFFQAPSALAFSGVGPYTATYSTPNGLGQTYRYMVLVYGIAPGASGTVVFTKTSAGTILSTTAINGAAGAQQLIDCPTFPGFNPTVDTVTATVTWAGGTPAFWDVLAHPFMASYYAVPETLPAGWTFRSGAEQIFTEDPTVQRDNDWPGRRKLNAMTPANYAVGSGFWIPEYCQFTNYFGAFGRTVPTLTVTYASDQKIPIPPFGPTDYITVIVTQAPDQSTSSPGGRKYRVKATTGGISTGGVSFTVDVMRSDGATITRTYTDAQLTAGVDDDIGAFIPSPNAMITSTLHVRSNSPYFGVAPVFTLVMHPRVDIPFPVTATNEAGEVVGGGIDPGVLTNGTTATMTIFAAGVTSGSSSNGVLPFAIVTDGWYQVANGGAPFSGVGENELDYQPNGRTADRGRAGRIFYAVGATGTLAPFVPVFTAIAAGGTSLLTNQGGCWGFGTIALPAAGTYEISIVISDYDRLLGGVVFEWSKTDPLCLRPDGVEIFQSGLLANASNGTTYSSPPASPVGVVGIAAVGATGAFAGWDRSVVAYNSAISEWQRMPATELQAGMILANGTSSWAWFDGKEWRGPTDPVIKKRITVTAATSLACTFSSYLGAGLGASPHLRVSWALVP